MSKESLYRLKALNLLNRIEQTRQFVKHHNLSIGLFAEQLIRDFLHEIMPKKYEVAHGFIFNEKQISHECDVIIYNSQDYAPIFRWNDFVVIEASAVHSVIEVKTSIRRPSFEKVLADFKLLYELGIGQKHLVVFGNCHIKTIESYLYPEGSQDNNIYDSNNLVGDNSVFKYNHDNYHELPDTILSLEGNYCLCKELYDDFRMGECFGYLAYLIVDEEDKRISSLQTFLFELLKKEHFIPDSISAMYYDDAIPLFPR